MGVAVRVGRGVMVLVGVGDGEGETEAVEVFVALVVIDIDAVIEVVREGLEPIERDADGVAVGVADGDGRTERETILTSAANKAPALLTVTAESLLKSACVPMPFTNPVALPMAPPPAIFLTFPIRDTA